MNPMLSALPLINQCRKLVKSVECASAKINGEKNFRLTSTKNKGYLSYMVHIVYLQIIIITAVRLAPGSRVEHCLESVRGMNADELALPFCDPGERWFGDIEVGGSEGGRRR